MWLEDIGWRSQDPSGGEGEERDQGNPGLIGFEESGALELAFPPTDVDVVETHGHRHHEGRPVEEDFAQVREVEAEGEGGGGGEEEEEKEKEEEKEEEEKGGEENKKKNR